MGLAVVVRWRLRLPFLSQVVLCQRWQPPRGQGRRSWPCWSSYWACRKGTRFVNRTVSMNKHFSKSGYCRLLREKLDADDFTIIPVLQTNNGPGLTGLMTIAAHLVKQAKKDQLLGSTAEEKAVVQQWLEYRVTRVDGGSSKEDTRIILKDLNIHLEDKVYLAGNIFTLADVLMYYGLHHIMVDLTVQEKEKYLNVSRWFSHIQHYPGVRQHLSKVIFMKNRLYTNAH
ncbi:eukaryotic translation elongation factor 1 epsilon-1 isoform X1 [Rissa tridactyla]|uniref:eukaryotic translation elongation factor 1 epsilon-1 isoform X1 n=1 Tax=Rissa tridactyla TaxID=75485 RepID=UPI0023BA6701|nr:eukaryotic translation elongation factor 1 epsilon-1 isoform X1 [Rissa tridactyla]